MKQQCFDVGGFSAAKLLVKSSQVFNIIKTVRDTVGYLSLSRKEAVSFYHVRKLPWSVHNLGVHIFAQVRRSKCSRDLSWSDFPRPVGLCCFVHYNFIFITLV